MNETLKTIHSLRTIHGNFSSQEVKDEDVKTILDACVRGANASARQSYSIIVVKDRELMGKLSGFSGSRTLIFCADYTRLIDTAEHLNQSFGADGVIPFVTAGIDTILAAQTAAIAAKSLGIDSLFTNGIHRGDITRVYKLLDLPEKYCFPMIALVLGYPDQEPDHMKGRLSGKGLVHYDKYSKATPEELDELVNHYDDPQNHMWLSDEWKEKGLKHYLDWFYSVWSARGGKPEGKSQMAEILGNIGFMD
ncbi:MAG: nitroreductase family protein [Deltaproteobacteria bacterium]|nr:nitroreductase family protein [Deltaproteobacteria bacterium]